MTNEPIKSEMVALALGSNLGDRLAALREALEALAPFVTVEKKSAVYETPPAYVTDQPAFLNAVIVGSTDLAPLTLLRTVKQIEMELGRTPTFHYGPRRIDIDIIFYGSELIKTVELIVPHPRLTEREFVLRPLADVAGDWVHPEKGQSVKALLATLPDSTAQRIEDSL